MLMIETLERMHSMTQKIITFRSLSLTQVEDNVNAWIAAMEKVLGFIAINISLSHSVDEYVIAILYGIRNTQYTTEELKV